MLKSNLCGYKNAYILVRGDETNIEHNVDQSAFKHCEAFIECITKIYRITTDDANDLDLVMPMYNLLVCS